jgi:hypothetical protein
MAGEKASQAAVAFEDLRNTRRLMGTVFMVLPPGRAFLRRDRLLRLLSLPLIANV